MRRLMRLLVVCGAVMAGGCSSERGPEGDVLPVWTGQGDPWKSVETPPGFTVSPQEAYDKVRRSGRLSLKHNWACYRDARFYYIYDSFGQPVTKAERAVAQGVRVDGVTGEVK